jgi:alkylation response protein AidB-like acyl-CoA dehydrogenase
MEQLHLTAIKHRAGIYDATGDWPEEDLDALAAAGAMRWAVPKEFGGDELSPLELHLRYEWIAAVSVSTALILTQRDSAVGLIDGSENPTLRQELMPRFARNEMFATVGIAQLTTSHQSGAPALTAKRESDGWHVNGLVPWSSGADRSRFVVAGAVLDEPKPESPRQILFTLSTTWSGVTLSPPMPLVALQSSHTGSITCEDVLVEDKCVLAGPAPNVLAGRKKTVPLGQAFLAMGLCRAGIELIDEHDSDLARQTSKSFQSQLSALRDQVLRFCDPASNPDPSDGPRLRGACNDLALRVTHAAVALYKGTALMQGHPAQRLAREALFLLVWSCPNPVIDCTIQLLASTCGT